MTTRLLKSAENINGLPIGFQEVEYLESTGTQYIDTNYLPTPTSSYKSTFQLTNITTTAGAWFCVFGSVESNNSTFTELFLPRTSGGGDVNQILAGNHNSSYIRVNYPWAIDTKYSFEMTPTAVSVNGVSQGSISVDTSITCSHSIYLFARHEHNDTVGYNVSAKIHSFTIYEGNTLVRDFIPALNPAGRPCMYDLVEKKAYYNLGTGEFSYGRKIIPVEYLESTGTQYIDTGYYPNNNTKYNLKTQFLNPATAQEYKGIIGVSVAPNDRCGMGFYNGKIRQQYGSGAAVYGGNYNDSSYTGFNNATVYECSRNGFYINGTLDWTPTKDFIGTSSVTAWIFNTHAEAEYNGTPQRLFYCKIYDNEVLIRDYIPCIDENNVGYMFDKVTHTCYLNAGTGTFNYGKKLYSSKVRLYKDSGVRFGDVLPKGLKRVEYLENTGVSSARNWISTGIVPDTTTRWEVRIAFNNTSTGKLMGCGYTNPNRFNLGIESSRFRFAFNGWFDANQDIITPDTNIHTWIMDAPSKTFTIDEYSTTTTQTFGTSSFPIALFGRCNSGNGNTETSNAVIGKIYYSKIWQDNVLVSDMVPVLDNDDIPCMYDKVSGELFYNKGTGEFTYGDVIPNKVRLPQSTEIRFPKGYTEVEYLQSTGTQYIDTGVKAKTGLTVEARLKYTTNTGIFCGAITTAAGSGDRFYPINFAQSGRVSFTYLDSAFSASTALTNGNVYTIKTVIGTTKQELFVDGVSKGSTSKTDVVEIDCTLGLFALHRGESYDEKWVSQVPTTLYYCKIWDNDKLIRYFIPALDPNEKPCMWDVVTKQPFYNQGTGEFSYGRSIQQVSYLESTGTQYIDTSIKLTNNHSVELDYQLTQAAQSRTGLFGALNMTGSNQGRFGSILSPSNQQLEHGYGAGNDYWQQGLPNTDRHKIYQRKNEVYFDGTLIHTFATATFDLAINAYLGNFVYTNYTPAKAKYYSSKWWDEEALIRDFVPAIDSNNVGFMFDRVTHTIFDNAGTGSFTYGSPVPNKIRD